MTMSSNEYQRGKRAAAHEGKRSGILSVNHAKATILQVYDRDWIQKNEVPREVLGKLANRPGLLWVQARVNKTGKICYVPFRGASSEIVSSNSHALIGKEIEISYNGLNIDDGQATATLLGNPGRSMISGNKHSVTSDIGGILV